MARTHISVSSAILLILTLTLTLGASRSASQEQEFQSINCGGEDYNDPNTNIIWKADPFNKNNNVLSSGEAHKVHSSFENITDVMKTLRYFPQFKRNIKFCYSLNVSNGSTYLVRASFLYGNYDGLNQPPTFVLIFNSAKWTDVVTSSSNTPVMHELTFISKGHDLDICLALHPDSNQPPFISTLELRYLKSTMYRGTSGALVSNFGLMLFKRINYGTTSQAAIRYPDDPYDRIWEADTTGPVANKSIQGSLNYVEDLEEPPAKVMATAITSNDSKGNLSFTYNGFGGIDSFLLQMHFQEVVDNAGGGVRNLGLEFPNSSLNVFFQDIPITVPSEAPIGAQVDQATKLPTPLQIRLFPRPNSPSGALLNAIELFRWTPLPLSFTGTFQEDVVAIGQIQQYFKLVGYGQGDPCMPKHYEWTWIVCNNDTSPRIIEINLGNFSLTGDIPQWINNITYLQTIDLSNNMLGGSIPDINLQSLQKLDLHSNNLIGELPPSLAFLPSLTQLDVRYNDLCGSLPSFKPSIDLRHDGNTNCQCDLKSSSNSKNSSYSKRNYILAISLLGALYMLTMLTMLTLFIIYMVRRRREKEKKSTTAIAAANKKGGGDDHQGLHFISKKFSYNEISHATLNFTTILGEGGFGKVYQGLLSTGEAIAVKLLADASRQGLKEFYNEVAILSIVRHKNLVSLIGYCVENTYMLIYEYVSKGNLRDLIYGDVESIDKPLSWKTRLQIAIDAAQGLEYLHTGCDPMIIHRDVKSSNILLSYKMQAKVSDFGLSRLKEGDNTISHVSTINVVGTPGYLDPAYNSTNQLTDKSDVYSFGIVLFELICGRAPIDMFNSLSHIVEWATPAIMQGKVGEIVDPMLLNGYKMESMWKVIDVAFGCVENDRAKRPKMSQVVQLLQNALEIEMEESSLPPQSQDISGSSSTSDGKLPILHYIESL